MKTADGSFINDIIDYQQVRVNNVNQNICIQYVNLKYRQIYITVHVYHKSPLLWDTF